MRSLARAEAGESAVSGLVERSREILWKEKMGMEMEM